MWSARTNRILTSTGARLALVQAALVIAAFGLAGVLTELSAHRILRDQVRDRVESEVGTLHDEIAQKGVDHLSHTVAKRSRQARRFDYRLVSADGRVRVGDLRADGLQPGWSWLAGSHSGRRTQPAAGFMVHTERLSDGSMLSVADDLTHEVVLEDALVQTLFWCGAFGAAFCLSASFLLTRGVWRRASAVANAAREVTRGRLGVRVRIREGLPRDDIDELGHAFNGMLAEIAALVSQVQQVSTDIAHDLRTPLARVRQRLEVLKLKTAGQPELIAAAEKIDAEIEEILRTFDAMLRLAELENAAAGLRRERIDLAEVAARMAEAYRPDIEESGRSLEVRLEPVEVEGEGQLIAQAMANLLDNALRHTPEGTPIELHVSRGPAGAELAVIDRGPGVAVEHRSAVLQRFRRLDASRSTRGSGLGLAIVAAIAKRHGAQLILDDVGPGLKVALNFAGPG
jgi:signal transduction histidine kinase